MKKRKGNPEFESKNIQFKVDEAGKVSVTIATFGVEDRDNDIIEPTAFKDGQEVPMVWSHNWDEPIGKGIIKVTPTEAIFEGAFFMDTAAGLEAYKTVKAMGNLQEWSWGFHTIKSTWEEIDDRTIRHLVETEIYEVSPVLKGAGIGTRTLAIKGLTTLEAEIKALLEDADSLGERLRSVKGLRKEEGREISEERCTEIKELADSLRKAADELEKSVKEEPAALAVNVQKEFNRYQLFEARRKGVGKGT
jgi:HK97 family phage prohead protease